VAPDGGLAQPQLASDDGVALGWVGLTHPARNTELGRAHPYGSAAATTAGSRGGQAGDRALTDQLAFHLGQAGEHDQQSPELDARGPRASIMIAANYLRGQRTQARERLWLQMTDRYLLRQPAVTREGRAGAGKSYVVSDRRLRTWRRSVS